MAGSSALTPCPGQCFACWQNPGDLTTAFPLVKQTWQGWKRLDLSLCVPTIPEPKPPRRLHPLPRGLVELYGLIAVLVVLIPEWIADGTLSLGDKKSRSNLPMASRAWRTLPELQLASMNLAALRQLGRQLRVWGYAGESRDRLTSRLLNRIKRHTKSGNAL